MKEINKAALIRKDLNHIIRFDKELNVNEAFKKILNEELEKTEVIEELSKHPELYFEFIEKIKKRAETKKQLLVYLISLTKNN